MLGVASFKKDPHSLLKISLVRVPFYLAAIALCFYWKDPSWKSIAMYSIPMLSLTANGTGLMLLGLLMGIGLVTYDQGFALIDLAYMAGAFLITFPVTSLYHSAAHLSLRPRFLNRWVGELLSLWHNVGIDIWSVTHHYHHLHTDVVGLDPHPSEGQKFWDFAKAGGKTFPEAFKLHFFRCHPTSPRSLRAYKLIVLNFIVRSPLATLLWFVLLGPTAFVYFYAVNVVFKKFHYAWFNWATHQKQNDKIQTQNLDHGFYKFINSISFNLYYHHNHHTYPNLMNPKKVPATYLKSKESGAA
jgi:fatty acid desaturase